MTQSPRSRVPEGTYFFTVCLADRTSALLTERAETLQAVIAEVRRTHGFVVDTFVILPDRILSVWTMPGGDADYMACWSAIRGIFEQSVSAEAGSIWQDRVKAFAIRSPADLERHRRICRDAPVDAGFVAEPSDWPHASYYVADRARHAA